MAILRCPAVVVGKGFRASTVWASKPGKIGHPRLALKTDEHEWRATFWANRLITGKKGNADEALQQLRKIMGKLKLTVNEEKTRICKVPEGEFDFLVRQGIKGKVVNSAHNRTFGGNGDASLR